VAFTDRHGGVSTGPYTTLNIGDRVGDDPEAVATNRSRLAASLDWAPDDPDEWGWLHQVHGSRVVTLDAPGPTPEADGALTTRRGLPLVVCSADCAPIALIADGAVGVVHAGWPGLEAGVVEAVVRALRAAGGREVVAVLGPCVHPARYEFGADLLDRLVHRFGATVAAQTSDGRPALDIPAAVGIALEHEGAHLDDLGIDTATSPDHFSHRRDGITGRQAVVVVRD